MKDREKLEHIIQMPTMLAIGVDGKNSALKLIVGDKAHVPSILAKMVIELVIIQKSMGLDFQTMLVTTIESLVEAANEIYGINIQIMARDIGLSPPKNIH